MSSLEVNKPKVANQMIGTHSGTFHCDEALAIFMLQCLPQFKTHGILRSRDPELLAQCNVLVDVGGVFDAKILRFDHHQASFKETFSSIRVDVSEVYNIRLSSAGLVYVHYGEAVISEILKRFGLTLSEGLLQKIFVKVYKSFVQEIDAIDNGVPQFEGEPKYRVNTHLSARVKKFNPDWTEQKTPSEIDELFERAKAYVGEEFVEQIRFYALSWLPARKIVEAALERSKELHESGEILELERFCPWQEHLRDIEEEMTTQRSNVKFVIFNSGSEEKADWRVQGVPVESGSFVCRRTLKPTWHGLRDDELAKVSGVEGAKFVHATGFIGGCLTRDGVLQMAIKSMSD